jgi:hypothetical protein
VIRWALDKRAERHQLDPESKTRAENTGVLLSSGFIAGEALMAVILAFLVIGGNFMPKLKAMHEAVMPSIEPMFWLGLLIYPVLFYLLAWLPVKRAKEGGAPAVKID